MGDILGAYSVIFAVITALFGLWYPEIQAYLNDNRWPPDVKAVDIEGQYEHVKEIRRSKIIPLLIISLGITIIFLPAAISIVQGLLQNGISFSTYDPISMCLLFLLVLNILLIWKIFDVDKDLREKLATNK